MVRFLLETPHTWVIGHGEIKWYNLEAPPPLPSSYSAGRWYACYWGRKMIKSYPAVNPSSYNNDGTGKTGSLVQKLHKYYGINQLFSAWTSPP